MGTFLAKKIHYFMVTMEEKNFAKAAERLCITRSPLSKIISEFEEDLGGKLFKRTYSNLEPTHLALDYYFKCKEPYDTLLQFESDLHRKCKNNAINILFDLSVPELLYQTISMGLSSEGLVFEHKRMIINLENINHFLKSPENIIFSLRDISSQHWESVDKWQTDELVLVSAPNRSCHSRELTFLIWNDNFKDYIKRGLASRLRMSENKLTFIEHNYDFTGLLYNIHKGNGCAFMTKKLAVLYKTDGVLVTDIKNQILEAFLYYRRGTKQASRIPIIREVLNKFI